MAVPIGRFVDQGCCIRLETLSSQEGEEEQQRDVEEEAGEDMVYIKRCPVAVLPDSATNRMVIIGIGQIMSVSVVGSATQTMSEQRVACLVYLDQRGAGRAVQ
jgi:hypothetical protein